MAKKTNRINPYVLALVAALLLSAAGLMKSFPVLVLAALAPLFALADYAEKDNVWNKLEAVGIALAVGLWATHLFETSSLVAAISQAIAITVVFVVYAFVRQALGDRLGKLPLLLFWLALEYLIIKTGLTNKAILLADVFQSRQLWVSWTANTGYAGISLWILLANLLLYHALLQSGLKPGFLTAFLIISVAPFLYVFATSSEPLTREMMIMLYNGDSSGLPQQYVKNGEWIPRTAAWVSALVILYALVKEKTKKKS